MRSPSKKSYGFLFIVIYIYYSQKLPRDAKVPYSWADGDMLPVMGFGPELGYQSGLLITSNWFIWLAKHNSVYSCVYREMNRYGLYSTN